MDNQGPVWDMSPYFEQFGGEAFERYRDQWEAEAADMLARVQALPPLTLETVEAWTALVVAWEALAVKDSHLWSYLGCLGAADTSNQAVQQAHARLWATKAVRDKSWTFVLDGLRQVDEAAWEALLARPELDGAGHFLRRARRAASHRMSRDLEALAADMSVDGIGAWGRLYDQVDGRLKFTLEVPGQEARQVPMAWKRSLTQDADPAVRAAALKGSNAAWESVAHVVAADLNAIAGTRLTLDRWRGMGHFLDMALYQSDITREALDAMMTAVDAHAELARRYLRLKARILGRPRLGFQDVSAPLPMETPMRPDWDEARRQVEEAFARYSPELGQFAKMAFDERWIDAQPRENKSSGGFCSGSMQLGQSRIFMTYNRTLGDVQTLAHELGHAFHSWVLRSQRPLARRYTMTLAETASMFAEAVLGDALLEDPGLTPEARASVLDTRMARAASSLLDIPMRYRFEVAFYQERQTGAVSVERLCELMRQAQRDSFGDTLAEDELDPWFWASKLHFHLTGVSFYNFPYTFGHFFSQAVFVRAQQEGPEFFETYKALLRATGSATPAEVARDFLGADLEDPAFWVAPMALIKDDLQRFEAVTGELY